MYLETIAVGNEIITGNTINSNASHIARYVQQMGICPKYHSAVGDEKEAIWKALDIACQRADLICCIGGLGPTEDDLTKEAVGEYVGAKWVMHEDILEGLKHYFERTGRRMPESNTKQALFPEGAVILANPNGTAPGCIISYGSKQIVLLPGPPKECLLMVENELLPRLASQVAGAYETLDIQLMGIGESQLVEIIRDLLGSFDDINIAPYVGNYRVIVRLTARGETKEAAHGKIVAYQNRLEERLATYIIGYNQDTIEENIQKLLAKHNYTIAVAESCTGGLVAGYLINASGMSAYLGESHITYSNEAKQKYLGVKAETLNTFGAVSKETAKEMAEGVKKVAGASIGLSTTGVAGPDGGTKEKPVGLVYIGLAIGNQTYVHELRLNGNRQTVRERTVYSLLHYLYRYLQ